MPMIGEVLADRYRVEALLGAGGMASVYRALDLRLAREVAVKILAPNLAADSLFAARFDREARALAAVAHPNVVAVYDVEPGDPATGREPFYVMELCDGGTLGDRLEADGPIPPAEVVPIIAEVAEGLAALHVRGLLHRDVKPHNILFQDDRAKLGDFGLARGETRQDLSTLTAPGATVGTLPYLAPEVVAGEPASVASDVYALAATTFQALSGRLPKPAGSMREIVEHRADPPLTLSAVAPDVGHGYDGPIGLGLSADPSDRPGAVAFAEALQAAQEGRAPDGVVLGSKRSLGAARAGAAAAVTAGAGAAGAAGAGARSTGAPDPTRSARSAAGSDAQTIVVPATAASGIASPNPDFAPEANLRRAPMPASGAIPGRPSRRARPDRGDARRLQILAGFALAVIALAIVVALAGLLGRALPAVLPSGIPGGLPAESTLGPSASPTASQTASPDPAASALRALNEVLAAIQAAQGGHGGLNGRDVNDLESLAAVVGTDLARHDYSAARNDVQTLAARADKDTKDLDAARRNALLGAIANLAAAIPA